MRKKDGNTFLQVEVEESIGQDMRETAKKLGVTRERLYRECMLDGWSKRKGVVKTAAVEAKKLAKRKRCLKAIQDKQIFTEVERAIIRLADAIKKEKK